MKTTGFEIITKAKQVSLYTHSLKFNGKLLSKEGYYHGDILHYENYVEGNNRKFLDLKIADIPDNFRLTLDENIYKEFVLYWIIKTGDEIGVNLSCIADEFEGAIWNHTYFFNMLKRIAKKSHFKPIIYSNCSSVELRGTYKTKASDTLQSVYTGIQKDFAGLYDAAHKELIKTAAKQARL